ncbi:MAG TPA: D-glycero-beta-D-manno-heptose 1,7-bisphosphate 7-phosphatase [Anaerolineae bacterium]|nr:D-glycero-beta-D-manno-heptose 1,7-bisphosphate 7-phosphatase [Anaerolineae bacterium]
MHPLAWIVQPPDPVAHRRPALFLDRDGVLNENRADYVRTWQQVVILPGVLTAMQRLAASPFAVVVVTNQSAVGRGLLSRQVLAAINQGIVREVQQAGGRIDAVYACPHTPEAGCTCRKPRPGMLLQAARELEIDLARSWLVGDAVSDMQAAAAAGCRPVLVRTGRGMKQALGLALHGLHHVPVRADLAEAVNWILAGAAPVNAE